MGKRFLILLVIFIVLGSSFNLFALGAKEDPIDYPAEMDAWLQEAKLGPYEGKQDWDEIEKLANEEGKVIVYSSSSRVAKVAAVFEEKYPGIKVVYHDLGSVGTVEKTISEQDANLFNVDLITTGGSSQVIHELLNNFRMVNFVPSMYVDQIPEEYREPLLARIVEGYVLMYNREFYGDTPPISNIWELTEEKWRGKVVLKDPKASGAKGQTDPPIAITGYTYIRYYEPGSKSPGDTVPVARGGEKWFDLNSWVVDPDFMWFEGLKVQDFWVQEVGNQRKKSWIR